MVSVFETARYQELNAITEEEFAVMPEEQQRATVREMAGMFGEDLTEDEITERIGLSRELMEMDPSGREEFVARIETGDREIGG
jgi:hypothetical protein